MPNAKGLGVLAFTAVVWFGSPGCTVEPADIARAGCCKVCRKGCACGDSCIACEKACHKGPGCACDAVAPEDSGAAMASFAPVECGMEL